MSSGRSPNSYRLPQPFGRISVRPGRTTTTLQFNVGSLFAPENRQVRMAVTVRGRTFFAPLTRAGLRNGISWRHSYFFNPAKSDSTVILPFPGVTLAEKLS